MSNRLTFSLASLVVIMGLVLLPSTVVYGDGALTIPAVSDTLNLVVETEIASGSEIELPVAAHGGSATHGDITYTLEPDLAALTGLTVELPDGTDAGSISGTPDKHMASTLFTLTATLAGHDPARATFNIKVQDPPKFPDPLFGEGVSTDLVWKADRFRNFQVPPASDGDTDAADLSYTLTTGTAPNGTNFDGASGRFVGTPDTPQVATSYVVTVTDLDSNTDTAEFTIAVVESSKPMFSGSISNVVGTVGKAIKPQQLPTATDADGDQVNHALDMALPAGLSVAEAVPDSDIWVLSGTPEAVMSVKDYKWVATDEDGNKAEVMFKITINPVPVPVALSVTSIDDMSLTVGAYFETILPIAATGTGVAPLTYTLMPTPPAGTTFDAANRLLKGTPTTAAAAAEYTYKVKDSAKADDGTAAPTEAMLTFDITVVDPDDTPLAQPDMVTVALNTAQDGYDVSWTFATGADKTGIMGYYVQYSNDGTTNMFMHVMGADNMMASLTAKPMSVAVWATADASDMSPTAPPAGITPPAADLTGLPDIPDGTPLAQPDMVTVALNTAQDGYDVSWTFATGADKTGIMGYYVQYSNDGTTNMFMHVMGADNMMASLTAKPMSVAVWATADASDMSPTAAPAGITPTAANLTGLEDIPPPPPANIAPVFLPSAMIADVSGRVGVALSVGPLPEAVDPDAEAGDTPTYSLAPMLDGTNGLMFDPATRMISGTPTAADTTGTSYTYSASDGTDSTSLDPFKIMIAANSAPAFTVTEIADVSARKGIAIAAVTLPTATDTDDTVTHTLTPATLPAGLTLTGMVISGTPTAAAAAVDYTWSATDGIDVASLTFMIGVAGNAAPVFQGTIATISTTAGTAITPQILPAATDDDGDAVTYTLTPALPAGLTYNTVSRLLSGTPTAAVVPTIYTYTASSAGTDPVSLTFIIEVKAKPTAPVPGNNPPTFGDATINTVSATVGTAITPQILPAATDDDDDAITYSLTPVTLPAGLTYNTATRLLSGTPTAVTAATAYTYTATDGKDSDTLSFAIVVNKAPVVTPPPTPTNKVPTFNGQTITAISGTVGTAIGKTLPEATDPDGDAITYSIRGGTLPAGLSFTAATRHLSGIPSAVKASTDYLYVASDGKGGTVQLTLTIEVNAGPTTPPPVDDGHLSATFAEGTGSVVGTTTIGGTTQAGVMIAANGFATIGANDLTDLQEHLELGGTIGLSNGDAIDDKNSRTVVISEILWGLDFGAPVDDQTQWQFIELYNTTNAAINLTGWTLTFTEGRPVPASDIDRFSNRAGAGWNLGASHGQSGRVTGTTAVDVDNTVTPVRIISMYRDINYDKVETEAAKATVNRDELVKGIPGGDGSGSWKASQRRSEYNRWIYDSRRDEHFKSTAILTASAVARSPFIINEIGNGSGDTNDWVELRNVTTSEASLKNYHLSLVAGFDKDDSLVNFHDKDIKVGGGEVILLVNTDPKNTEIAAGRNAAIAEVDQELTGVMSRYYISANLKLPDDGKFNLILRNAHDKLKASSHFMDVVGGLVVTDGTKGTSLWPLVATGGPHGDVVEANGRDLKSGYAYIRKNAGGGTGEHHLGRAGYTGIGYDRVALKSDANGGTPGYDNGAVKEKIADITTGEITISEVMTDTGEARQNLAQWIELYNSSMTQSVNLNGWKLQLENAATNGTLETNTFSATITFDAMTISPNQTVLIVTTSGRVSDTDHFPSTRVVNLWTTPKHRNALEMARRTDPVLSLTGFHLKLTDKDGNLVDEGGNLDGNRRTRDDIAWALPASEDDGRRSSMIRVYDDGVAVKGTLESAWLSADATNLAYAISHTFYGDADDFGTPGFRGGGPVPVSLSKFRPERLDDGTIVVRWVTESELNNAGFNILRSETRNGQFTQMNTSLIKGQGTTSERTTYSFPDTSAKPNVVYYYQIQDVSLDGNVTTLRQSRLKGDISAAGKLTTTWGELKALQ